MDTIKVKPGTPRKMDNTDTCNFTAWIERVDSILLRHYGLTSADLPDCLYADWFESRLRPIYAAKRAIKNAKEY